MDEQRKLEREGSEEDAYDVGDAFGEHNIEYWIYDGKRLVPASPDEQERLREWEQRSRLEQWKAGERRGGRAQTRRRPWPSARQRLAALSMRLCAGQRDDMAAPAEEVFQARKGGARRPERPSGRISDATRPTGNREGQDPWPVC